MKLILIIFGIFFSLNSIAKTVYVLKATGAGVSDTNLQAVTELVESSVSEAGDYQLTENRWKADFELRPKLTKLGSSYIMAVHKSKNKKTLTVKKMKAANIEDMDTVVSRIVRACLNDEDVKTNSKVYEVTEDEQDKRGRRYKAHKQYVVGFGPGWGSNLETTGASTNLLFGRHWNIDDKFDLGIVGEYAITPSGSEASFVNLSVDFNYFLSNNSNAFYLIGGLGYGSASVHMQNSSSVFGSNDSANGFALKAGTGMRFFRSSTVNFGVLATYTQLMKSTKSTGALPGMMTLGLVVFYE